MRVPEVVQTPDMLMSPVSDRVGGTGRHRAWQGDQRGPVRQHYGWYKSQVRKWNCHYSSAAPAAPVGSSTNSMKLIVSTQSSYLTLKDFGNNMQLLFAILLKYIFVPQALTSSLLAAALAVPEADPHGAIQVGPGGISAAWPAAYGPLGSSTCYGCRGKRSAEAEAAPEAEPHYGYGYRYPSYGYRGYYYGKRSAEAEPHGVYGVAGYGYGLPGHSFTAVSAPAYGHYLGKRSAGAEAEAKPEAEASPEAEAAAEAEPHYGAYGYGLPYAYGHVAHPYVNLYGKRSAEADAHGYGYGWSRGYGYRGYYYGKRSAGAEAEANAEAEASPEAEAAAEAEPHYGVYGYGLPYAYGHVAHPYVNLYGKRSAGAEAEAKPEAEASPEAEAAAEAEPHYGVYGYGLPYAYGHVAHPYVNLYGK